MAELADELDELDETLFTAVLIMCCVTFYRIAATIHTALGLRRHELTLATGAILGTFSKDFYLKTCINNF